MNSLFIITLILYVLVIPTEIFALALLISFKQSNVRGSQKFILIALCTTELIYAKAGITYFSLVLSRVSYTGSQVVLVFSETTLTFFYIFIMTLIAIDRFLEIYLNIKYSIFFVPPKDKIYFNLCLCNMLALLYTITYSRTEKPTVPSESSNLLDQSNPWFNFFLLLHHALTFTSLKRF